MLALILPEILKEQTYSSNAESWHAIKHYCSDWNRIRCCVHAGVYLYVQ